MAFYNNAINTASLPIKSVPLGADSLLLLDSSANDELRNALTNALAGANITPGWVLINTQTASNSPTINFNNLITSTYNIYAVRYENVQPVSASGAYLYMLVGTGSGPTFSSAGYATNGIFTSTGSASAFTGSGTQAYASVGVASGGYTSGRVELFGLTSATANKRINFQASNVVVTPSVTTFNAGCLWANTTVVTSLQFLINTGNISVGNFYLYGLVP